MAVLIVDHSNPFEIAYASRGVVPMITVGEQFLHLRQESQLFVYFHECAHHVLGHVTTPTGLAGDDTRRQLEADCWAAHKLDEIGHFVPEVLTGLEGVLDDNRLARIAACAPGSSVGRTWGYSTSEY